MEIELATLYNRKGEKDKANQLLEDAKNALTDPMCPESRDKIANALHARCNEGNTSDDDITTGEHKNKNIL